jgi:ribonuclease BN (tRNA processing enzyme)
MVRFDVDWRRIDRLFVTHLHGDHIAGWPFLLLNMVVQDRRTRPFDVYGPVGTKAALEGLVDICFRDAIERQSFDVRYNELPLVKQEGTPGRQGMQFDLLPMEHHASSLGYRFHVDGSVIGISGDTGWCKSLELLAKGCDVLITECTSVHPEAGTHLCLDHIRAGRDQLGEAQILLVHLSDSVAEALARDPIRDLLATYDGMIYLP